MAPWLFQKRKRGGGSRSRKTGQIQSEGQTRVPQNSAIEIPSAVDDKSGGEGEDVGKVTAIAPTALPGERNLESLLLRKAKKKKKRTQGVSA